MKSFGTPRNRANKELQTFPPSTSFTTNIRVHLQLQQANILISSLRVSRKTGNEMSWVFFAITDIAQFITYNFSPGPESGSLLQRAGAFSRINQLCSSMEDPAPPTTIGGMLHSV
jgi:hypothetical protein